MSFKGILCLHILTHLPSSQASSSQGEISWVSGSTECTSWTSGAHVHSYSRLPWVTHTVSHCCSSSVSHNINAYHMRLQLHIHTSKLCVREHTCKIFREVRLLLAFVEPLAWGFEWQTSLWWQKGAVFHIWSQRNGFQGHSLGVGSSSKAGGSGRMVGSGTPQGGPSIFHELVCFHRFNLWDWRPAGSEGSSAFQRHTQRGCPGGPSSILQCDNTSQEFASGAKIHDHTGG